MGLLSSEVLGDISSEITGNSSLNTSSLDEFTKIIRKIIPEKLEEKYIRLEKLVERYQELVKQIEANNQGIDTESYSEELSKEEIKKYLKRLSDLEKEFIENEKHIAVFPYTDTTNERISLLNKNHNIYTQRINLQKKIYNISIRMKKNLFTMSSINKSNDELMSEVNDLISEITELRDEIALLSLKDVRLDKLNVTGYQKKEIFGLIENTFKNLSIEEIKEKFMSIVLFVMSYLELRKSEYRLVKQTSDEIESKYKSRELLPSNYESFNLLHSNRLLTAPLFMSDNIMRVFSFDVKDNVINIQDNNMLSETFMLMSKLMNKKLENDYSTEKAASTIESMKKLSPKNETTRALIGNTAKNLERLEIEEKKKKGFKENI